MVNHPNQVSVVNILTWQSILWRLVVTALLLLILAGSSLTVFSTVATQSDSLVLPTLTRGQDAGGQESGDGRSLFPAP